MTYQDKVKKHLEVYKKDYFPENAHGIWARTGKVLPYAFNASPEGEESPDADLNLIINYKDDFLSYEKSLKGINRINRHMYFHHMNSSQAMCFNFFYPLYKEEKLELITDFLGMVDEKIDYTSAVFEKGSNVEGPGRRETKFDFYFKTQSGREFFFEIKYTEQDFGKAPKNKENKKEFDKVHKEKFHSVYSKHLYAISQKYSEMNMFLENYQILRNLINVDYNKYVVFIYPKGNKKVKFQAELAKKEFLNDDFKGYLLTIEWEDIFGNIKQVHGEKLKKQYEEFERKYLKI